jgi:hypothetical protein
MKQFVVQFYNDLPPQDVEGDAVSVSECGELIVSEMTPWGLQGIAAFDAGYWLSVKEASSAPQNEHHGIYDSAQGS